MWILSNRLKLNSEKPQFQWLGRQQPLNNVNINSIILFDSKVNFQSSVGSTMIRLYWVIGSLTYVLERRLLVSSWRLMV